jgi:hypothetical protein
MNAGENLRIICNTLKLFLKAKTREEIDVECHVGLNVFFKRSVIYRVIIGLHTSAKKKKLL